MGGGHFSSWWWQVKGSGDEGFKRWDELKVQKILKIIWRWDEIKVQGDKDYIMMRWDKGSTR